MKLNKQITTMGLFTLLTLLPLAGASANPGKPGMMPCGQMHQGSCMGPMGQGPMGDRPPMEGMPGDMMQHRRHHKMMQQRMMGKRGGQMKRRMMQQRMQHMRRMEERLANIESLLQELVELQKQGQQVQQ